VAPACLACARCPADCLIPGALAQSSPLRCQLAPNRFFAWLSAFLLFLSVAADRQTRNLTGFFLGIVL
jgi:hypothetical protein